MGSYVISVSLGTGCYRHIQISQSATLYKLHKAILDAFEFVDGHAHAFFLDNRTWSQSDVYYSMKMDGKERLTKDRRLEALNLEKGSRFKYVFDFEEEWLFQCKILRVLEEDTKLPALLREVGEAPFQYGDPDWDEEEDFNFFPELYPQEMIQRLYEKLPIPMETVEHIHQYFAAAARLYGAIPVLDLLALYNMQNDPVEDNVFLELAEIIRHEKNLFSVLGMKDFENEEDSDPGEWYVIDDHLLLDDPEDFFRLLAEQSGKPYRILPKEDFLKYCDHDYFPWSPQSEAMKSYLFRKKGLRFPKDTWLGIQTMIEVDFDLNTILHACEHEGLRFENERDLFEFAKLYQELNNHTRKQINRGHTPKELFQKSLRSMTPKTPSRNGPCPCGSGLKYKRCCGKQKHLS